MATLKDEETSRFFSYLSVKITFSGQTFFQLEKKSICDPVCDQLIFWITFSFLDGIQVLHFWRRCHWQCFLSFSMSSNIFSCSSHSFLNAILSAHRSEYFSACLKHRDNDFTHYFEVKMCFEINVLDFHSNATKTTSLLVVV